MSDIYADIRPYNDTEVGAVIERLLADGEFITTVAGFRLPRLTQFLPWAVLPVARRVLRRELAQVEDVASMQRVIKFYMDRMIATTSSGFSCSGLERLAPDKAHLFMSNHRDIAMDPAFTNYALFKAQRDTVRIAIGDNLLTKPWVSDLMRLNKSFIVERSATAPRQMLKAFRKLSAYIAHSIQEDNAPIWIAQREGRAKDGVDHTEPALIKMLAMNKRKGQALGDYLASLRLVPMAISYELDPCDARKAAELSAIARDGQYHKSQHEDVLSIGAGITGDKAHVHVAFGTPLAGEYADAEAVAAEVDRQVLALYRLHPTNLYAYEMLYGEPARLPASVEVAEGDCSKAQFEARILAMPEADRPFALANYANAVVAKLEAA
ncbi:MAG: glycerol acyltransferase [Gammaproteobacteria bacterium]|nr:MAG: glycerol acyltransferase [Gammaproteobacteria bacterium]PIE37478.1 MAG: glycerol acyltransferase [Gammaproteobacteria bacterium]